MNYVERGWLEIKNSINLISECYSFEETKSLLTSLRGEYEGRAKNRTMMKKQPKLYKSLYLHSAPLQEVMEEDNRDKGWYNFSYRIKFIVDMNGNIEKLRCKCGRRFTWNTFCRQCPDYHKTWKGKKHSKETRKKQRISTLNYLKNIKGQVIPRYNVDSIKIIEDYGQKFGYSFQHAENGGEYYIKELGYFLDAYDKNNNIVLEIDEKHHYDSNGNLKEKDSIRQEEIKQFLNCQFIRMKI